MLDVPSQPDLWDQSVAIRSGSLTSVALVEECQRHIGSSNEFYKVFISIAGAQALEEAKALDVELAAGQWRGPLHGIPLAIKDNIDVRGFTTTAGSRVLSGNEPTEDAPLVSRLREAGAVIVGKTNMDEFAYGFSTENQHYGTARNPYDTKRIAGGSSGGSAVAVALGMSSGAIGTDTNGSIRVPSSFCSLIGLRPTYGRVSLKGIVPLAASFDQAGPITRSVRDAALILSVITEHKLEDPGSPSKIFDYETALSGECPQFRIGVPKEYFFEGAEAAIVSSVEKALELIEREGHDLVETALPKAAEGRSAAAVITAVESTQAATKDIVKRPELLDQTILARLRSRSDISKADYANAKERIPSIRAELLSTLDTVDVIATPTCPLLPIFIGEEPREIDGSWLPPSRYLGRFTSVFGLAHLPALSVPCGFSPSRLPIGMQLITAPFHEAKLLQLGQLVENS